MKKALNSKISKFLTVLLLINVLIFTIGLIPFVMCSEIDVNPTQNNNILIDGNLDDWNDISSYKLELKTNVSNPGLPIDLKCAQDKNNLYLAIYFELEPSFVGHSEFLGILISPSEDATNLTDARIVNMTNSQLLSNYTDYTINNYSFTKDSTQDGEGCGVNKSIGSFTNQLIYEFKIPLNDDNDEDVDLQYGSTYAFNISQGNDPSYPQGIIRSNNSVVITIKDLSTDPLTPEEISKLGSLAGAIAIFVIVGLSYGYYIYRIVLLRKKMERIK